MSCYHEHNLRLCIHLSPVSCSAHLWAVKVKRELVALLLPIDMAFWHLAEQVSSGDLDGEIDDMYCGSPPWGD